MEVQDTHAKAKWAQSLGVSKSGYYAWLETRDERQEQSTAREEKVLTIFEQGKGHYGAERICGIIRSKGGQASFAVVKRIMDRYKLKSHCRRR